MNGIVPRRVERVFDEAMEKPPNERPAFLETVCAGDPELRAQVDKLLLTADRAGEFLSSPTVAPSTEPVAPEEREGARIGPYKLLQRIGEGGFATVYMCMQTASKQ